MLTTCDAAAADTRESRSFSADGLNYGAAIYRHRKGGTPSSFRVDGGGHMLSDKPTQRKLTLSQLPLKKSLSSYQNLTLPRKSTSNISAFRVNFSVMPGVQVMVQNIIVSLHQRWLYAPAALASVRLQQKKKKKKKNMGYWIPVIDPQAQDAAISNPGAASNQSFSDW